VRPCHIRKKPAAISIQLAEDRQSTSPFPTMSDNNKYQAPSSAPPTYPQQAYYDGGPYDSRGPGSPPPQNQIAPYQQQNESYGGPQGQYGPPGQYGYPQIPNNPGWGGGPPPGGYYGGPPQGGMYYQQQPPMGYYQDQRGGFGSSAGGGICAGLMAGLACCCCLDLLI
jgi:hypothetical protein